jgi:hypothetical protein
MTYTLMGWFNVRYSAGEDDRVLRPGDVGLETLRRKVAQLDLWTTIVEMRQVNGCDFLLIFANQNHARDSPKVIDELLSYVSEHFPGTYGLLHEQDDELGEEWFNKVRLRMMVRGELKERDDPFFSPFQPVVEDGGDPT